jgi:arabinoxylan arabinofuranohydrolase
MKRFTELKLIIFIVLIVTIVRVSIGLADNPIVQTVYTADPAPMVHDGVCYVYTSHDEDVLVRNFFTMNNWRCYSTIDMVNWTDLGSPLSYKDFSWARGDAWAGQCIYRNGKFYFYVPMNRKNAGMAVGVAVSDKPEGPFTDPIGKPLVYSGHGDIDPSVFIDDDGQAYLYWGNPNLYYVKLNEDMISYSGQIKKVPLTTESFGVRTKDDRPTQYEEGPWLYKRNDLYYLIFAAGPISEHISYSTSPNPTGPWTFGGIVMPTQGGAFTNHPGVCDYKGNSYFFYHNAALPGGGGFNRSVCVEQFEFNNDGTIPTINMTREGAPQIGRFNPYNTVQAETICWESGVETQPCSEGGMNVYDVNDGDFIRIKGVDFGTGATSFEARVASATRGGNIEIRLDGRSGTLAGTCAVPGTSDWQTWVTASCMVKNVAGVHDLYLVFTGGSGLLFNVNWWRFKPE